MRDISGSFRRLAGLPDDRSLLRRLSGVDWSPLLVALLLASVGLVIVHSASAELGVDLMARQLAWIGIGLLAALVIMGVDYQLLKEYAVPIYGLAVVALGLVLVVGSGPGGATRWLVFGGLRFQPSELAKLATVLLLTRYLASFNSQYLGWRQVFMAGAIVAPPMTLIVFEPDLGGALLFVPVLVAMLLVAGVRLRLMVVIGLVTLLVGGALWHFGLQDYQKERVQAFLQPEADPLGSGYQLRQSKIAVGSGQLTGRGYLQGTQSQLRFLPERHTDFIFAVLAEEWGFLGVLSILGLYGLLMSRAVRIATRARDRAGILLVSGVVSLLGFHVLYNTAMVIGLVPISGIPLPFVSYGGSFMLVSFLGLGLVLSVDLGRFVNR